MGQDDKGKVLRKLSAENTAPGSSGDEGKKMPNPGLIAGFIFLLAGLGLLYLSYYL